MRTSTQRFWQSKRYGRRSFRPSFELLETRTIPALVNWINPLGGSWHDAGNWSTGRVPGLRDDVIITVPGDVSISYSSGVSYISSLTSQETVVLSGGTLTLDNDSQAKALVFSAGKLAVGHSLTVSSGFLWTGGTLSGRGALRIAAEATAEISGAETKMLSNVSVFNDGVVTWSGTGNIVAAGAEIINGGEFHAANDQVFDDGGTGLGAVFHNNRLLRKSAGQGVSRFGTVVYNAGRLEASSGTMILMLADMLTGPRREFPQEEPAVDPSDQVAAFFFVNFGFGEPVNVDIRRVDGVTVTEFITAPGAIENPTTRVAIGDPATFAVPGSRVGFTTPVVVRTVVIGPPLDSPPPVMVSPGVNVAQVTPSVLLASDVLTTLTRSETFISNAQIQGVLSANPGSRSLTSGEGAATPAISRVSDRTGVTTEADRDQSNTRRPAGPMTPALQTLWRGLSESEWFQELSEELLRAWREERRPSPQGQTPRELEEASLVLPGGGDCAVQGLGCWFPESLPETTATPAADWLEAGTPPLHEPREGDALAPWASAALLLFGAGLAGRAHKSSRGRGIERELLRV